MRRGSLKAAAAVLLVGALAGSTAATAEAVNPVIPWGAGCRPVATSAVRTSANCGAELVEGQAIAPPEAPTLVKRVIAAANEISDRPYVWGGGHRSFFSRGYDCSGAVSYALHGAGLLTTTMVSGQLALWGKGGVGRWITIYANAEHVFMVVAGLRFDTREDLPDERGPRWKMSEPDPRLLGRFAVRHPDRPLRPKIVVVAAGAVDHDRRRWAGTGRRSCSFRRAHSGRSRTASVSEMRCAAAATASSSSSRSHSRGR